MAYAFAIRFAMIFPLALSMDLTPEITYQRVEQTMGFDIIRSNFRITKFNRTCAVLNGTAELLIDLDNHYTVATLRKALQMNRILNLYECTIFDSFKSFLSTADWATISSTDLR